MDQPPSPPPSDQLPPPDRSRIQADLELLANLVGSLLATRMPASLRAGLTMVGLDPARAISSISRIPSALSDRELSLLILAAAQELGAWHGAREPVAPTPELEAALRHLLEVA